jgi:hypothetical protein
MWPEEGNVPDLLGAAKSLDAANTAIKEAINALRRPDGSKILWDVATRLGMIADLLRDGRLLAAMKTHPFDIKYAAAEMGRSRSPEKLDGIATARLALAAKRSKAKEYREMR